MASESESGCCSICLESFHSKPKNRNKIFLECGHEFCFTCIIPQMKQKNTCPLCRALIDKKGSSEHFPEKLSHTGFPDMGSLLRKPAPPGFSVTFSTLDVHGDKT